MVITLFRHGVTEENKRKAYLGWNDSPLCGEEKKRLASLHLTEEYDLFFSSDLERCLATLRLLEPKVDPIIVPEFREMCFGEFEGKTYHDLKENVQYKSWLEDWLSYSPPGGESYEAFSARIISGWNRILDILLEKQARGAFIMTHGGVIKYLLTRFAPEEKNFWEWSTPHGNGFELTFDLSGIRRGDRCTLLRVVPLTEKETG
ncbi:histidine phosphatase family protein [Cytobacillus sp. FJAT-54145]|uniref:Histidine phosphatase family protein n=1 Tax=Cytobacillus spartinae TaxID=3299023 RepID=A0ABW6KFN1_9BACI